MVKHVCKGCQKPILIPGFCSPVCARKNEPKPVKGMDAPSLMGSCHECKQPWGALHYVNGRPMYFHVRSQGGCAGATAWAKRQGFSKQSLSRVDMHHT